MPSTRSNRPPNKNWKKTAGEQRGAEAKWDPTLERCKFGLLGVSGHPEWQQSHGSPSVTINPLLHQPGNLCPGGKTRSLGVMRGCGMLRGATGSFAANTLLTQS